MKVAVIQYNAGNICSVDVALRRLGVEPLLTDNPEDIASADRVVFPGQGEAATTMNHLRQRGLDTLIRSLTQPCLGICIGMQLLCTRSDEGGTACLDVFGGTCVERFAPADTSIKVPHMGWNTIENLSGPLFRGIAPGSYVYFVHSYFAPLSPAFTTATTTHGRPFSAAMQRDNFYATQFHPEKSGAVGQQILSNFLSL